MDLYHSIFNFGCCRKHVSCPQTIALPTWEFIYCLCDTLFMSHVRRSLGKREQFYLKDTYFGEKKKKRHIRCLEKFTERSSVNVPGEVHTGSRVIVKCRKSMKSKSVDLFFLTLGQFHLFYLNFLFSVSKMAILFRTSPFGKKKKKSPIHKEKKIKEISLQMKP